MGEFAQLVVCGPMPVARLRTGEAFSLLFGAEDAVLGDGWRVARLVEWPDLVSDALDMCAEETGMPVLFTDGDGDDEFVLAALHLPSSGPHDPAVTVNCWLGAEAAREAENDLDGYAPDAAHQLALLWSAAAGLSADPGALAVALAREGLRADDYLRLFLYGLGIPGMRADDLRLRYGLARSVTMPEDDPVTFELLNLFL